MIGVYDFCGHYDWTFEWLRTQGGEKLVRQYWDEAIHRDAQRHAWELIQRQGLAGMAEYWGHTLKDEGAGYTTTAGEGVFRIDMHRCPSKGFLLRNGLAAYHDYCDHCMGWIGPMLSQAGFTADHEHNHCGQCWWEIRRASDDTLPSEPGKLAGSDDVRLRPEWKQPEGKPHVYRRSRRLEKKSGLG
jgi:hypothetical protein